MSEPTQEELQNMSPEQIMELQKKNCIFCKMIAGEIPTYKIYDDDKCFAILDINPANEGHVLLLPKQHYQILPQMPQEILGHITIVAKKISKMMLATLKVRGTSLMFEIGEAAGQKAPHVMLHIIPAYEDKNILKPKLASQDSTKFHELLKLLRAKTGYNPAAKQAVAVDKTAKPIVTKENKEEKEKIIKNFEDPKKVAKVGVNKEKGYLYYVDKEGDISRAEMARGRKTSAKTKLIKKTEKVKKDINLDKVSKLFN